MHGLIAKIDEEASRLPPEPHVEVIDFTLYLNERRKLDPTWLEQAWGVAPDFPDREPQPPLSEVQGV